MKQILLVATTLFTLSCNNEGETTHDHRGEWHLDTGRVVVYPLNSDVATIDTVVKIKWMDEGDSATWILKPYVPN